MSLNVSIKTTTPRGCLPGETELCYLDICSGTGATDADAMPTVTVSLLNQVATTAGAATVVRVSTGLYKVSIPTPTTCTWCDDISVLGTAVVGGVTYNWVAEFSIPFVAIDVNGCVLLQPSEHINEIPSDFAAALLQYAVGEYSDPANPSTSPIRLTATGLANTPVSGGLTASQSVELNLILDGVNRSTDPLAILNSPFLTLSGASTLSTVGETLTYKQVQALIDSVSGGDNVTSGPPVASGTVTVTYYLRGQAHSASTITQVATVTYDANKQQVSRTVKIAQPFPAVS